MKPKEARRVRVVEKLVAGGLTIRQAAVELGLSERQVKRLKKGVLEHGIAFLAHKNRGRKPKHAIPQETRELIISLATGQLKGASCEHMAELLATQYGISIAARSIRRILAQAGVNNPHTRKAARRRRSRERMPQEGLLVQCDASPYAWLEERGPWLTLHGAIDDASGKVLGLCFRPHEDLLGYLHVLWQMVENFGVPQSLYTDRHTIFFSPEKDKLSLEEELAGKTVALTQLGKVLESLGVNHIPARSPQAKGRVERLWGTLQSRLLIEMRLAQISSLEEANAFLPGFIERFNQRFAVLPANPEPAFRSAPHPELLNRIIAVKEERRANNGSVISYYGKLYQLVTPKGSVVPLAPEVR